MSRAIAASHCHDRYFQQAFRQPSFQPLILMPRHASQPASREEEEWEAAEARAASRRRAANRLSPAQRPEQDAAAASDISFSEPASELLRFLFCFSLLWDTQSSYIEITEILARGVSHIDTYFIDIFIDYWLLFRFNIFISLLSLLERSVERESCHSIATTESPESSATGHLLATGHEWETHSYY